MFQKHKVSHGGACVLFLVAPEGELHAVEGREEAHAADGVLDVRIYREPGHVFGPLLRGADRAGAVIAVGDEPRRRARPRSGRRERNTLPRRMTRETQLGFQPPAIGEEEIEAVADALRSGWLTTGPRAALLEERMAEYLEAKHVLAVASGTAAMHLALVALGIGPGDEVITTPITWPATANVIVHTGATPVFVDVRDGDLNIDPALVAAAVTERTKAIMPVHLAGQPCDMDPIWALGIPVIEDAAHAAESAYRGRKLGGLSEATCFSLYATKNIAAGEGGLISTNDDDVAEAIRDLRLMRRGDGSLYDLTVPGYKANLSDVLAAIALVQLDKLPAHTARPRAAVRALRRGDRRARRDRAARARPARHARAPPLRRPRRRRALRADPRRAPAALAAERISTSIHFLPVHRLTWYRERFPDQPSLPVAERAGDEILSLPLSPAHSDDDIADVLEALARIRDRAAHEAAAPGRRDAPVHGPRRRLPVWKIDLGKTVDVLAETEPAWFALSVAIMILTALPMALRWQWLLAARGMHDSFLWLTRAYFVSYTASQVLPTSIGGDAVRVVETSRRHPGRVGDLTAIVAARARRSAARRPSCSARSASLLAIGRYDVGAYLWLELLFVLGTIVLAVLFFSRSVRPLLARSRPLLARLRLERPLRAFYEGVHAFRPHGRLLAGVFSLTFALQAIRVLSIWAAAKAVGIDLSPLVYYVMGPLFFLVLLVPFTLNGFAVREAFFVSFLGQLGVDPDAAFAAGFLFFLVTVAMALPGGAILLWEGVRGGATPTHA